jgi:hypothetical protein
VTIDGERRTRICRQVFWLKGWASKKNHQELMAKLGDDASGLSQIKIWLQRFRTGNLHPVTFLVGATTTAHFGTAN